MGEKRDDWGFEGNTGSGAGVGLGGAAVGSPLPPHHVTGEGEGSSSISSTGQGGFGGVAPHHVTGEGENSTGVEGSRDVPHKTGWLDVGTEHINRHLRAYRTASWVVGSVGVVLLLRFSRVPLKRFRQVSDIPADYVLANRKLSGVVAATKWNTIGVWHVPGWRWLVRYETKPPSEDEAVYCTLFNLLFIQRDVQIRNC